MKKEDQRRVIQINKLESGVMDKIQGEFNQQRPNAVFDMIGPNPYTFKFRTIIDTTQFGRLLDQRQIPYSMHPAKDYNEVATRDLDEGTSALFNSI